MEPLQGDRIIIKNLPDTYLYKGLYEGTGTIDKNWDGEIIGKTGNVGFFTGYVPYKDEGFALSGGGHSVNIKHLHFVETKPAPFWRFKNRIRQAGNSETYYEPVNYFECEFKDLR
ncbi:MAG TPA: hypothetical protein ACFYD4_08395 [Candidatus Wunengus sp. YC61]|uniref:hypothetical protein n=1 Tax=Candidatus Wunengus sp. YC61 TaxID=3367698 RepID=UPI0040288575